MFIRSYCFIWVLCFLIAAVFGFVIYLYITVSTPIFHVYRLNRSLMMSYSLLALLFLCILIGQSSGFFISTSLTCRNNKRCISNTPPSSSAIVLPSQAYVPSSSSHRNQNIFRLYADAAKPAGRGPPPRKAPKDDVVQVNGKVVESLPNAMFRVEIEPSKAVVLATISGKIRKNSVRIVVGDSVVCELSAYDLTKGRITYRNK